MVEAQVHGRAHITGASFEMWVERTHLHGGKVNAIRVGCVGILHAGCVQSQADRLATAPKLKVAELLRHIF